MPRVFPSPSARFYSLTSALALLALLTLGGCANLPKPSAHVVGVHMSDLKLDSATLVFDVAVDNPYSVKLPLANFTYSLASAGTPFITGDAPVQGVVPASGSATVSLPAVLNFAKVFAAFKEVRPGSVIPYDADLNVSVQAPLLGKVGLPLKKSGQLPIPAIPVVEVTDVQWNGLNLIRTEAVVHLHLQNPNQFPLDLTRISLGLALAGHEIANSAVEQPTALPAGGDGSIAIPLGFSPKDLGLSVFQVLQGKGSDYHIAGVVAANTPYGPLTLPYDRTGSTSFK